MALRRARQWRGAGRSLLASMPVLLLVACASAPTDRTPAGEPSLSTGRATEVGAEKTESHALDLELAHRMWPAPVRPQSVSDLLRLRVEWGERSWSVDTHLFGDPPVVIPYHDADGVVDAEGRPVERGDAVLAHYFPPGEIGIAVRHHRAEHRVLEIDDTVRLQDEAQLRDTHVEIVVGVEREGRPGVVTLNSPQGYEAGRFGNADYPMIFFRLTFPDWLDEERRRAFRDNIRSWLLIFNGVLRFPFGYLQGDALGASTPAQVREQATMAVRAVAGDEAAREWFARPENRLYCSELAFLASSAGLWVPLNRATLEPLVGEEGWRRFAAEVERHLRGEPSGLTDANRNPLARLVDVRLAPPELEPLPVYAPAGRRPSPGTMALRPMTLADVLEQWLRTYLPRERLGEEVAAAQAALLESVAEDVLGQAGLDRRPADDPERRQAEALFARILEVVGERHGSYRAFRRELDPLLAEARVFSMRSAREGRDLLVPPHLFHVAAAGTWPAGLLGVEYVGHGFHWSLVRRQSGGATGL